MKLSDAFYKYKTEKKNFFLLSHVKIPYVYSKLFNPQLQKKKKQAVMSFVGNPHAYPVYVRCTCKYYEAQKKERKNATKN